MSVGIALFVSILIFPIGGGGLFRGPKLDVSNQQLSKTTQLAERLPSIGEGPSDTQTLNFLIDLSTVTSKLRGDETILNLSNRVALTGIFGWKSPTKILTPYTLASIDDEREYLSQLEKESPDYLFLSPGVWHDGKAMSLRNPLLYRWVVDRYSPFQCGVGIWATKRNTTSTVDYGNLSCSLNSSSQNGGQVQLWSSSIGSPGDLSKIPIAWGKRGDSLIQNGLFNLLETAALRLANETVFKFSLPTDGFKSGDLDLLVINSKCEIQKKVSESSSDQTYSTVTNALLTWGGSEIDKASFEWSEGTLIFPLDSYPSWIINRTSNSVISLRVPNSSCVGQFDIQVSGLRRQR